MVLQVIRPATHEEEASFGWNTLPETRKKSVKKKNETAEAVRSIVTQQQTAILDFSGRDAYGEANGAQKSINSYLIDRYSLRTQYRLEDIKESNEKIVGTRLRMTTQSTSRKHHSRKG